MELLPSGELLAFEVTFSSPGLPVAMTIIDVTATPAIVVDTLAMLNVYQNTYYGTFTAADGHTYLVVKSVYTDGTFTALDSNYSQGSESFIAQTIGGGGGGGSVILGAVIGYVQDPDSVVGLVNC